MGPDLAIPLHGKFPFLKPPLECFVQGISDTLVNKFCLIEGSYTVYNPPPSRELTQMEISYFNKFGHNGIPYPGIDTRGPQSTKLRGAI